MQHIHILFVYNEELKGGILKGGIHCLLTNQLKFNCSHSGVNVCAHLLRLNFRFEVGLGHCISCGDTVTQLLNNTMYHVN